MLAGPAAVWLLDWTGRSTHQWRRVSLRLGLVTVLAIALVGGTAAGLDASYRFPGPFLYGSDARSVTPELLAASEWFSARFGTDNNVITDRYTGLIFASFGLQNTDAPSSGFPVYNLYLAKPDAPIEPAFLLPDLGLANYTYLIVDERMAYDTPEIGVYFTPADPASVRPQNGKSPFYGRLNKFNTIQWTVKVFQSDNYSIYRLDLPATQIGYQRHPPRSRGKRGNGEGVAGEALGDPMTGTRRIPLMIKPLWLWTWPFWALLVFAASQRCACSGGRVCPCYRGCANSAHGARIAHARRGVQPAPSPTGTTLRLLRGSAERDLVSFRLARSVRSRRAHHGQKHLLVPACGLSRAGRCSRGAVASRTAGRGRRAARRLEVLNRSDDQADDIETPAGAGGAGYYSIVAVVAGVCLLAGGLYAYDHLPHPAPTGYTWMAWTGPPIEGDIAIGSAGKKLSFQIVHHQSDTTIVQVERGVAG